MCVGIASSVPATEMLHAPLKIVTTQRESADNTKSRRAVIAWQNDITSTFHVSNFTSYCELSFGKGYLNLIDMNFKVNKETGLIASDRPVWATWQRECFLPFFFFFTSKLLLLAETICNDCYPCCSFGFKFEKLHAEPDEGWQIQRAKYSALYHFSEKFKSEPADGLLKHKWGKPSA